MLSDISSVILTTDLSKLLLGGSILLGGFVGVSYGSLVLLNKKKNKEKNQDSSNLEVNEPVLNQVYHKEKEDFEPMSDLNRETEFPLDLNGLDTDIDSQDLLESAILFDSYGSKKEAIELLVEALNKETNPKEVTRLKFIFKRYETGTEDLKFLTTKFPSFLKKQKDVDSSIVAAGSFNEIPVRECQAEVSRIMNSRKDNDILGETQEENNLNSQFNQFSQFEESVKNTDNFDLAREVEKSFKEELSMQKDEEMREKKPFEAKFSSIEEQLSNLNNLEDEQELVFKNLIEKSSQEEVANKENDDEVSEKIFSEFGKLAQQIHSDFPDTKPIKKEEDVFKVWVNYMGMKGGKMNLQNKFINLTNHWGSEEAISEVQRIIDNESGKDEKGNKNAWAIISIIPVKQ